MKVKIIGPNIFRKVIIRKNKKQYTNNSVVCRISYPKYKMLPGDNVLAQKIQITNQESGDKKKYKRVGLPYVKTLNANNLINLCYPHIHDGDFIIVNKIKILDPEIEIVTDTELEK